MALSAGLYLSSWDGVGLWGERRALTKFRKSENSVAGGRLYDFTSQRCILIQGWRFTGRIGIGGKSNGLRDRDETRKEGKTLNSTITQH